ncbi:kinase-like protein [Rhodotorula sp. JG-1b]|nr:kinase-like protein [Rhodotorula sp. JG-1b]
MGFASFPTSYETLSPFLHERYLLVEEIGVGGSGFCLKIQRRADNRIFAAKLIAKDRIAKSALIRTLRWGYVPEGFTADQDGAVVVPVEAWALRRVSHANVCAFEELFADATFYYLIMEHHGTSWQTSPPAVTLPPSPPITPPGNYLDLSPTSSAPSSAPASAFPSPSLLTPASFGALPPPPPLLRRSSSDLFEAVERHRHFSEHHARHIFVQILAAVCDLARTGIIHRDLKDENITLAEDTLQVKLVDFGSCVLFNPQGPPPVQAGRRFYGTWTYAAPEVFTGEAYAMFPAEIWSLGVLLHVLLTGENPFPSAADARAGRRMRSKGNVRLGEEASDLIDRCLTVESERRITLAGLASHPWISGHSNRRAGAPSY